MEWKGMTMSEVESLKRDLLLARLRAKCLWFTYSVPDEFISNRTRTAYDGGYEAGWRGWEYMNSYYRPHFQRAYRAGYNDAKQQLHKEALSEKYSDRTH